MKVDTANKSSGPDRFVVVIKVTPGNGHIYEDEHHEVSWIKWVGHGSDYI